MPQKIGKHKKRVSNPTPRQCDASIDPIWSAPVFNFDEAFDASAMSIEPEMPSFDFGATDFDFSPNLNDDWQLFPDLPMTNNNSNDHIRCGHNDDDDYAHH